MLFKLILAAAVLWYLGVQSVSADACEDGAGEPLEKAYCQVKAAGFGAALPPLHEFKRNPVKTQRLLLLRPAQRAGVSLPQAPAPKATAKPPPASTDPAPAGLSCLIREESLLCGEQRYQLLGNRANRHLAASALTSANQLQLAPFLGRSNDQAAVMSYLKDSYRSYIEAMVSIGLAASTMSFTKFYHTFVETQGGEATFAQRMATMFEFLKQDKKTMAVQAHFNAQRPQSISQCRRLSEAIIVCDDVKNNWVFQL